MPKQDRTGTKYERLIAFSLEMLGYARNTRSAYNYLQPPKNSDIVIDGTYIQPDFVVREDEQVCAVIYSTHWSNTRSSKYKFWRTWEEQAQQRVMLGNSFLAINCVFEALPEGVQPLFCVTADQLPIDSARGVRKPIQLAGWDPGIGWALVESFDINILFPKKYAPTYEVKTFNEGDHDPLTTQLLKKAIKKQPKAYFRTLWNVLREIKSEAPPVPKGTSGTRTRYRIGFLHVYMLCRILEKRSGKPLPVGDVINALTVLAKSEVDLKKLHFTEPFNLFTYEELKDLIMALSEVYVRKGDNPAFFCNLRKFSVGSNTKIWVSFNEDLKLCVNDLVNHLTEANFIESVQNAFGRFNKAFGVYECISDLSNPDQVTQKVEFVEKTLLPHANDPSRLGNILWSLYLPSELSRCSVSDHIQNWHLEILLYLCGLNSTEDIQTRFKERFEAAGHKLRPHAPYGDHAKAVAFMLQGRDLCELWSERGRNRTLLKHEFRELAWRCVAQSITDAINDRGDDHSFRSAEEAKILYLQNKSMRIISSDLNGFDVLIDHYLGDICYFKFVDEDAQEVGAATELKARICRSWQTDMVKALWGSVPLETWVEGVSKDGKWLIKAQSSQDGNEGHKTKELSGRCRAMHVAWEPGEDIQDRSKWCYGLRGMPKTALVLDGDWNQTKKNNLYEAGWDWVGDVTELHELRKLILESKNVITKSAPAGSPGL